MKTNPFSIANILVATSVCLLVAPGLHAQSAGSLTPPPGSIVPTMRSLDQIDPGIALDPTQFPATGYVITQPGSYYLIGNVTAIVATEAAITINASDVTLDLRGFAIIAASGSGTATNDSAIVIGSGQSNVTVRNGTIAGPWYAGLYGVSVGCAAQRLHISRTNSYGIRLGDGAEVTDCEVEGSGVTGGTSSTISIGGIVTSLYSLVKNCSAAQCAGDGISTGNYSLMLDCAAHDNGADGLQTFNGVVVSRCAASQNGGRGVLAFDGCAISQCSSSNNGSVGIAADEACSVNRSTASANGTSGFVLGDYAALVDCIAIGNASEGYIADVGCALRNCSADVNGNDGFRIGAGSVLQHCTAQSNGGDPANTAADGFELTSVTRVTDCAAIRNGGSGIRATSFSHYIDSSTVVFNSNGGITLPNNGSVVIWNRVDAISPAPSNYIGPFNDARTFKPFSNF